MALYVPPVTSKNGEGELRFLSKKSMSETKGEPFLEIDPKIPPHIPPHQKIPAHQNYAEYICVKI